MLNQHQIARTRVTAEELSNDRNMMAKLLDELVAHIPDPADQRGFSLLVAASVEPETLRFLQVLGHSAEMVSR